jgi:hypothetical protein
MKTKDAIAGMPGGSLQKLGAVSAIITAVLYLIEIFIGSKSALPTTAWAAST